MYTRCGDQKVICQTATAGSNFTPEGAKMKLNWSTTELLTNWSLLFTLHFVWSCHMWVWLLTTEICDDSCWVLNKVEKKIAVDSDKLKYKISFRLVIESDISLSAKSTEYLYSVCVGDTDVTSIDILIFYLLSFPPNFALASPSWTQVWLTWNFSTTCRMASVHSTLLSSAIWPILLWF